MRSILDYGSFIYFPTQKHQIEKIEKIQYMAVRLALGYRNSTPTNILLSESKLPFIEERTKFLCKCFLYKIHSHTELLVYKTVDRIKKKLQNNKNKLASVKRLLIGSIKSIGSTSDKICTHTNYTMYTHEYTTLTSDIDVNIEFGKTLKNIADPNTAVNTLIEHDKCIAIYTDGSKSKNTTSVGSACICTDLDIVLAISTHKEASIFTAECIALMYAVDIASKHPDCNFSIFTDSRALTSLKNIGCIKILGYCITSFYFKNL